MGYLPYVACLGVGARHASPLHVPLPDLRWRPPACSSRPGVGSEGSANPSPAPRVQAPHRASAPRPSAPASFPPPAALRTSARRFKSLPSSATSPRRCTPCLWPPCSPPIGGRREGQSSSMPSPRATPLWPTRACGRMSPGARPPPSRRRCRPTRSPRPKIAGGRATCGRPCKSCGMNGLRSV